MKQRHRYVAEVREGPEEHEVPPELLESEVRDSEAYLVDAEDGTGIGVVDKVVLDEPRRIVRIDVYGGWFGRRRCSFDPADVVAVDRIGRLLVVSDAAVARLQRSGGLKSFPF